MVPVFVILTILAFITYDYFFNWRPAHRAELSKAPVPLKKLLEQVPKGVFFLKNFTWALMNPEGTLSLGLNPMLLGITGKPDKIQLLIQSGQKIKKGDPIAIIHQGEKRLTIYSEWDAVVKSINPDLIEEPVMKNWIKNWVIKVVPDKVEEIVANATFGDKAVNWLQETYNKIKNFISESVSENMPAYSMADGGELPVGVLASMDKKVWDKFEREFLQQA